MIQMLKTVPTDKRNYVIQNVMILFQTHQLKHLYIEQNQLAFQLLIICIQIIPSVYSNFFKNHLLPNLQEITIINKINLNCFDQILISLMQQHKLVRQNMDIYTLRLYIYTYNYFFVGFYNDVCKQLKQEVEFFTNISKESKYSNRFIIIASLKSLATKCQMKVRQILSNSLFNLLCSQQQCKQLTTKLLQWFQLIQLSIELNTFQDIKKAAENSKLYFQLQLFQQSQIQNVWNKIMEITNSKVVNNVKKKYKNDGTVGILIQTKQQTFLIHNNKKSSTIITNTKYLINQWTQLQNINTKQAVKQFNQMFKLKKVKSTQPLVQHQLSSFGVMLSVGSSLGYCLANINQYEHPEQFLKDFGKICVSSGSLSILITKIPILGQLLLFGGLGYVTLQIFIKQQLNDSMKAKEFIKLIFSGGATIGSSIGGAIVGQILIPIPILGAFLGGLMGSFVGSFTSSSIISLIEKQSFKSKIIQIEKVQKNQGNWNVDNNILDILGVNYLYFKNQIPEQIKLDKNSGQQWLFVINFIILTINYSNIDQKLISQLQKKKKGKTIIPFYKKKVQKDQEQKIESEIKLILTHKSQSIVRAQKYLGNSKIDFNRIWIKGQQFIKKILSL